SACGTSRSSPDSTSFRSRGLSDSGRVYSSERSPMSVSAAGPYWRSQHSRINASRDSSGSCLPTGGILDDQQTLATSTTAPAVLIGHLFPGRISDGEARTASLGLLGEKQNSRICPA